MISRHSRSFTTSYFPPEAISNHFQLRSLEKLRSCGFLNFCHQEGLSLGYRAAVSCSRGKWKGNLRFLTHLVQDSLAVGSYGQEVYKIGPSRYLEKYRVKNENKIIRLRKTCKGGLTASRVFLLFIYFFSYCNKQGKKNIKSTKRKRQEREILEWGKDTAFKTQGEAKCVKLQVLTGSTAHKMGTKHHRNLADKHRPHLPCTKPSLWRSPVV